MIFSSFIITVKRQQQQQQRIIYVGSRILLILTLLWRYPIHLSFVWVQLSVCASNYKSLSSCTVIVVLLDYEIQLIYFISAVIRYVADCQGLLLNY